LPGGVASYLASAVDKPERLLAMKQHRTEEVMHIHLYGAQRAEVGLEDILETLTGADVDLESFAPPLQTG
jgi:hypothetical protein